MSLRNLTVVHDPRSGISTVTLEMPDRKLNVLTPEFLGELDATMTSLGEDSEVTAIVVASSPTRGFLAGADVEALLEEHASAATYAALSTRTQEVFGRIEAMKKPVVAAIDGACLGGGLELALACHARVASERARLGTPEIRLGLIPGGGGTVRLPRLVGLQAALRSMLEGKHIGPREALSVGLVDEIVDPSILESVARERADASRRNPERPHLRERISTWIESAAIPRTVALELARRRAKAAGGKHMPAPRRLLDVVEIGLREGPEAGFRAESEAFGELAAGVTAGELMRLFVVRDQIRRERPVDASPRSVENVGIAGAGFMGADIGYVAASQAGVLLRLLDQEDARLCEAVRTIETSFEKAVQKGIVSEFEARRRNHGVTTTLEPVSLGHCDLVLEAVPEQLELKQRLLAEVEAAAHEELVFASNTSALLIRDIARHAKRPHNVVGMHFFSPVLKMPLVEIARPRAAAPEAVATCVELAKKMNKVPIVVEDSPGFYTTRILAAYLAEAYRLLHEGVPGEVIDEAVTALGFPIGPFALSDRVGLKIASEIEQYLAQVLWPERPHPVSATKLVRAGRDGRRLGFYRSEDGCKRFDDEVYAILDIDSERECTASRYEIGWRCVLQMVNEAVQCLDEGVVHSARDADIGAVLGLGFPPHLGGPIRLVARRGGRRVADQLARWRDLHGPRFEPNRLLRSGQIPVMPPSA